jgi:YfiR/HmsC-like
MCLFNTKHKLYSVNVKFLLNALVVIVIFLIHNTSYSTNIENKLKATFLVNLIGYIQWEGFKKSFTLCLHSSSPVNKAATSLASKFLLNGKRLVVINEPIDAALCDVAYWDLNTIQYRKVLDMSEVVEVSDVEDSHCDGIDVLFHAHNNQLKIFINKNNIEQKVIFGSLIRGLSVPPENLVCN